MACTKKLGVLEIGRFIAASLVLLQHLPWLTRQFAATPVDHALGGWAPPGLLAVQFFFVLSGFVMLVAHHQDFGRPMATLNFWWRRACRIFPIYWLSLFIAFWVYRTNLKVGLVAQMVLLVPEPYANWVAPAWSLRYEIAFYIIFGLCLLPRIGKPLLAGWVGLVAWNCFASQLRTPLHGPYFQNSLFVSIFELLFFTGLLSGWLYLRVPLRRAAAWSMLAAGLGTILACGPALDWGSRFAGPEIMVFVSLGFGGLILGLANLERLGVLRTGRLAAGLGSVSYPLYILHISLMIAFCAQYKGRFFLHSAGLNMLLAGAAVAIYAISAAASFWVDAPLQRLLRHRTA